MEQQISSWEKQCASVLSSEKHYKFILTEDQAELIEKEIETNSHKFAQWTLNLGSLTLAGSDGNRSFLLYQTSCCPVWRDHFL